jgi:hypothetical protein
MALAADGQIAHLRGHWANHVMSAWGRERRSRTVPSGPRPSPGAGSPRRTMPSLPCRSRSNRLAGTAFGSPHGSVLCIPVDLPEDEGRPGNPPGRLSPMCGQEGRGGRSRRGRRRARMAKAPEAASGRPGAATGPASGALDLHHRLPRLPQHRHRPRYCSRTWPQASASTTAPATRAADASRTTGLRSGSMAPRSAAAGLPVTLAQSSAASSRSVAMPDAPGLGSWGDGGADSIPAGGPHRTRNNNIARPQQSVARSARAAGRDGAPSEFPGSTRAAGDPLPDHGPAATLSLPGRPGAPPS